MTNPTYYTRLTDQGSAALNDAITGGGGIKLSELALGDAGGTSYDPDGSESALRNEMRRIAITSISQDVQNPAWLVIEAIVPPDIGGWWIREAGVFDEDGNMFAIAKYPETYKAQLSDGTASTLTIQIVLQITNSDAIQLVVNPLDGYATQGWVVSAYPWATEVDAKDASVEKKVIDPKRLHQTITEFSAAKQHTHAMGEVNGLTEALADKSAAGHTHRYADLNDKPSTVSEAGLLDVFTKTEVEERIAALVAAAPGALNTLDELAAALGDNPNFATDILNAVGSKLNASVVSSFSLAALALTSSSAWRSKLGLGSAATKSSSYFALASHSHGNASETAKGFVQLASQTDAKNGTSSSEAVHPKGLKVTLDDRLHTDEQSFATNGYTKLPSGILLQWGRLTNKALNQTFHTALFPKAFPVACYSVSCSIIMSNTVSGNISPVTQTPGKSSFKVAGDHVTSTATGDIYWQAIGR